MMDSLLALVVQLHFILHSVSGAFPLVEFPFTGRVPFPASTLFLLSS